MAGITKVVIVSDLLPIKHEVSAILLTHLEFTLIGVSKEVYLDTKNIKYERLTAQIPSQVVTWSS